jgi:hypothetical protein
MPDPVDYTAVRLKFLISGGCSVEVLRGDRWVVLSPASHGRGRAEAERQLAKVLAHNPGLTQSPHSDPEGLAAMPQ